MTDDEIKKLAREVVNETLHRMGLDPEDPETVTDLHELKGLLGAWRATKKTVGQTIARVVTVAVLSALAAGSFMYFRSGD